MNYFRGLFGVSLVFAFLVTAHSFLSPMKLFKSLTAGSGLLAARRAISASDVLKNPEWPEKWPFTPRDFARQVEKV
jgi:hypothetical protein